MTYCVNLWTIYYYKLKCNNKLDFNKQICGLLLHQAQALAQNTWFKHSFGKYHIIIIQI